MNKEVKSVLKLKYDLAQAIPDMAIKLHIRNTYPTEVTDNLAKLASLSHYLLSFLLTSTPSLYLTNLKFNRLHSARLKT